MASITEHDVTYNADGGVGTRKVHYIATGPVDGPLIIFVHGWPAIASTWKVQLGTFASLGFRAVAPDMPGHGKSDAHKEISEYSIERLVAGLLAVLGDTGRDQAVWVAHDWGSAVVSSFAAHYPEKCKALVLLSVPYRSIELGLDALVKTVDRDLYPAEQYPYGPWDYMRYYEENFEKSVAWFESDVAGFLKACYSKPDPGPPGARASTAVTRKQGGWAGGIPKPPAAADIKAESLIDQETYDELVAAFERTGFTPSCAYYMNHGANYAYNSNVPNDGELSVPVLFVQTTYDNTCEAKKSGFGDGMRKACKDLTELTLDAGHWGALERPRDVNAALARFLVEKLPAFWPVSWDGVSAEKAA